MGLLERLKPASHKALALVLSAVVAFGCSPSPVFAAIAPATLAPQAASSSSLYDAYRAVLADAVAGSGDFTGDYGASDTSLWAPEYALFDFAADGSPELLVRTSTYAAGAKVRVYEFDAGAALAGSYAEGTEGSYGSNDGRAYTVNASAYKGAYYGKVNVVTLSGGTLTSKFAKSATGDETGPAEIAAWLDDADASRIAFGPADDLEALASGAVFDMASASVTVTSAAVYDGTPQKPSVTVSFGGRALVAGTDYTLSWTDNVNAGTATVTAVGAGAYAGRTSATFSIGRAPMSDVSAAAIPDQAYTGSGVVPSMSLTYAGMTLRDGSDYEVAYSDNTEVGTAKAVVAGKGNYMGVKTVEYSIKYPLSQASVADLADVTYTGLAFLPRTEVSYAGRTLSANSDYTLAYADNVNAGTAKVTVEGTGDYMGRRTATFAIEPAQISASLSASSAVYNAEAQAPSVTARGVKGGIAAQALTSGTDYKVSYLNSSKAAIAASKVVGVDSYYAVATGIGNYTGTVTMPFSIARANIAKAVIGDVLAQAYTGSPITPAPPVKLGSRTLTKGTDYKFSYSNNVSKGTATITATGLNNYTGTATSTFAIGPSKLKAVALANATYAYDGKAKSPKATVTGVNGETLTNGTHYTLTTPAGRTAVGTYTYTATGKGNYTGTVTAKLTITRAQVSSVTLSASTYTYNGSAKSPTVTVKGANGEKLKAGTDYTLTTPAGRVNTGTYTYTVVGKGNYTGTKTVTMTIKPANLASIALSTATYTYNGSAKSPGATVKGPKAGKAGQALAKNTDYTLTTPAGRVNAGTYTYTATGKGNYTGTVTAVMTVKPAAVPAPALAASSYTYDGSAKSPAVTVKSGSTLLKLGTDYTVSYQNNVNAGTAKAVVTGKGNYTGATSKTFSIGKAAVTSASLSQSDFTYNGKAQSPTVTARSGAKTLTRDVDYTLTTPAGRKNAGTYTYTVTGKGNYTGTATTKMKIAKAENGMTVKGVDIVQNVNNVKKKSKDCVCWLVTGANGTVSVTGLKSEKGTTPTNYSIVNNKLRIKKGAPAATHTFRVNIKAAGDDNHKSKKTSVTFRVTVK